MRSAQGGESEMEERTVTGVGNTMCSNSLLQGGKSKKKKDIAVRCNFKKGEEYTLLQKGARANFRKVIKNLKAAEEGTKCSRVTRSCSV